MLRVFYTRIDPLYDDSFFEKKLSFVSEKRRKKVLSYKNQADRCRSLAVGLLFMYGCEYVGFAQDVFTGENGKPQLAQPNAYFNLSHAGNYAVAAFSDRPVGIDVECCGRFCKKNQRLNSQRKEQKQFELEYEQKQFESVNEQKWFEPEKDDFQSDVKELTEEKTEAENRMHRIACKILIPQEMKDWECIPSENIGARESELIRIWTRKEAFAKMNGRGLSLDFTSIDTCDEERFLSWKLGELCWVSVALPD